MNEPKTRCSIAGGRRRVYGRLRHLAASDMALSSVLKVLLAVYCLSEFSGASNPPAIPTPLPPPSPEDEKSESSTIVGETYTETARLSAGVESTTQLLAELGIVPDPPTVELARNGTGKQETIAVPGSTESLPQWPTSTEVYTAAGLARDAEALSAGGGASGTQQPTTGVGLGNARKPYVLPTPRLNHESIQVEQRSIQLCLLEPVGPEGSITYFLVTESYLDGIRTWNKSHDLINGTTVCLSKHDLTSGVPYKVSVVARDDDLFFGRSESEFVNITTELSDIEIELDPPVEFLDMNSTRVTLHWSFKQMTHIEKFTFTYNQTDKYPGGSRVNLPVDLHGGARNVTLQAVFPGASYVIRLEGFSGPYSSTVLRRWIPETEPPSHLRAVAVTAWTTELTWTFPPHTPPPLVRHFMVSYTELHSRSRRYEWTNLTSIQLHSLVPDTKYEIKVSTISINGRPSYPRNITMETGLSPPRILMYSATSTSFTLDWEPPRVDYHHIVTCAGCPTPVKTLPPGMTRVTFHWLLSGNEYNGTLQAVKNPYTKSELTIYRKLTYPQGPTSVSVHLVKPYGTSLEASWRPAICAGCKVDSYTSSLWISKTAFQVMWKHSDCSTVSTECRLVYDYLIPGQEYRIEVNAIRMGLMSHPSTSSRAMRIPPASPGPISFPDVGHNQISIVWQPSRGILDKYIIGVCEVADATRPEAACLLDNVEVNSSITKFKCQELKTETRYNITLSSSSGGVRSAVAWVVQATSSHFPAADSKPPKAPSEREVTPYTFPVTFDTNFFDNSNRDLLYYSVLVAEASAVSHADLPTRGNLSEGLKTRTWATAMGEETIQRYQIADRYPYEELVPESGKREAYAKRTIVIGEEDCLEEQKDVYCNGPLKDNKIYVYQFRAYTDTGYSDTPFSRHVILPEDNSGVVAGISVVLILLFIIVLVLIGMIVTRRFRSYGQYMTAKSMEPLPVRVMTRASTSKRYSRPVRLTDFCHDFQVMNAHCHYGFSREYESIMKVGRKMTCHAAVLAANVSKNRYTNILPFDRTRVMLSPVDDVEGSDYINANYILGYESPREYIACQGPLPGTVDDMWRMIWEQDVTIIVMLTQLIEKATVKCDQYWEEENAPFLQGNIQVTLTSTEELEHWHIRDFTLFRQDVTKKVRQFHYLAWPDHGVPDSSEALLGFIRAVREQMPKKGKPAVVHCSAGVGRTGTFICLDHLMRHMEDHDSIDILSVTCDLRLHRSFMVQTEQQYVFIHKCVLDILKEKGIAPRRLPSISSMDSNDMVSTRQGSEASATRCPGEARDNDSNEMVVFRSRSSGEATAVMEERRKRMSTCSMSSPKRLLISSEDGDRSSSPGRLGSNGSAKKLSQLFRPDVREEFV